MAKDYFQDILPPQNNGRQGQPRSVSLRRDSDMKPSPMAASQVPEIPDMDSDEDEVDVQPAGEPNAPAPERSIRNIPASPRRMRDDMNETPRNAPPMQKPKKSKMKWLWLFAAVFLVVSGILLLIALRGTSVSVEPRTHTVVFDETSRFTTYPQTTAPTGTLVYTTQTVEVEDSEPVESSGTVQVQEKASGNITIFNNFQTAPLKFVKNTRFQTADGLIFRAPADIVVPGKSGTTPGQVTVTVVADAAGEKYNIAPSKLTLPGLKGTAEFDKVYAQSSVAFTGGFSGDRPGISESSLGAARTAVRGRLEQKIRESISALATDAAVTFPELAQITYTDLPTTSEAGSGARIHEKATALVPIMQAPDFALAVARTVSADTENVNIRLVGIKDFGGLLVSASSTPGTDPLQFQLTGQAMLIWGVNAGDLAQALAGRDKSAFSTIITGFPGIESAKARIEPFWSTSFPGDAGAIRINISDPAAAL